MTSPDGHAVASATFTYLAEPADPVLSGLLEEMPAAEVLAGIRSGLPRRLVSAQATVARWRSQLERVPADGGLAEAQRKGIRLICPGDPEWPPQLDDLGARRPYALWVRGSDLRSCCAHAVSVVGSRAATAYGTHVAMQIAADLAERGWAIVSGAAYGIDAAAHHGALLADGRTVAVLACGADVPYPPGHATLLGTIAANGTIVSEYPPGRVPTRTRFLARNRIIAALSAGTVVAEAGLRSGTLNTARQARELGRPVMAVPGPVTSSPVRRLSPADPRRRSGLRHQRRRRPHPHRCHYRRRPHVTALKIGSPRRSASAAEQPQQRSPGRVPGPFLLVRRSRGPVRGSDGQLLRLLPYPGLSACAVPSVPATGLSLRSPWSAIDLFPSRGGPIFHGPASSALPYFGPPARKTSWPPGPPGVRAPPPRRCHLTAGKGTAVPRPPPGRPTLPVTAPGGTHEPDHRHRHRPPRR